MTSKQTPQPQKSASDVTARHHPLTSSSAAAKVTPHEPDFDPAQSSKGVRFATVSSNRGRYASPGGRAPPAPTTTPPEQSAVGSPAPSLCSAPSRDDEPRKPAAVKSAEVRLLCLFVKSRLRTVRFPVPAVENIRLTVACFVSPVLVVSQPPTSPVADPTKSPTGLFLQASPGVTNTPTNFATDYSSTKTSNGNFDTSNVLAWLQSPTGLFSPGWNSIMNTPRNGEHSGRGGTTPVATVSTSFFFSDVAGLPKTTVDDKSICISPLATHRQRGAAGHQTPVDMKEIFSSPTERKFRAAGSSGGANPSLDATVLAERELMEDEDLSVLLQLASNTTPRHSRTAGGNKKSDNENLQLPMIGNNGKQGVKPRLQQKNSGKNGPQDDFAPPHLGMRGAASATSSSSTKDKEVYVKSASTKNGKKSSYAPPPYPDNPYYTSSAQMPTGSMRVTVGAKKKKESSPTAATSNSSPNGSPPPRYDYPYQPHMAAYPFMAAYPPYSAYPPPPLRPSSSLYGAAQQSTSTTSTPTTASTTAAATSKKRNKKNNEKGPNSATKRKSLDISSASTPTATTASSSSSSNKASKTKKSGSPKKKNKSPMPDKQERAQAATTIQNLNAAAGGHNDKAAALAAAILRGVTMRPSGKWQAQLYFCGKSRYIGVFDTREKAALAYEIAREKLKTGHVKGSDGATVENLVNSARKAAFDGVNEQL